MSSNDSAFSRIMKLLDKKQILDQIQEKKSDRWTKKFSTRDHLACMIFAQLVGSKSLRQLEVQFSSNTQNEYNPVKRSTLSDANKARNCAVFEAICRGLMFDKSREIKELVRILDSTPISFTGRGSNWAIANATSRTQGLKLHIQFAPESKIFDEITITHPNVNDVLVGKMWKIKSGITYIFDKGYLDYNWWHKIHKQKAFFVSRIKKNTAYFVVKTMEIEKDESDGVLSDQIIRLKNKKPRGGKVNFLANTDLRLIVFYDSISDKNYSFISNNLSISAQEIASLYKKRWEIELIFKWIKQNLKIKQFFGTNENAIKIQIYAALISYMLLISLKKIGSEFTRTIDFLTWVQITIFSSRFLLRTITESLTECLI